MTANIILSDISTIVDCEHKTAPLVGEGIPSIRTPNIGRGRLLLADVNCVDEKTYQLWTKRAVPKQGDLILAREAPVGNVAIIPKNLKVCLGQRTVLIRPKCDMICPEYLNYFLNSNAVNEYLINISNGATVGHLNVTDIRRLKLSNLLPLLVQRKIAAVLSAYDDLIENNNRRIAILEKMAEELYREWFVRLRFPGYEKAKIIKGVPEGWEVKALKDVALVIDCLHTKKPEHTEDGEGWLLQLENIKQNGRFYKSVKYCISKPDYEEWTKNIEVTEGDCLITNVGRIAAIAQIPSGVKAALGRNMTAVRPKEIPASFLIQYLLSSHMQEEVTKKQDLGAIMGALNVRAINKLQIMVSDNILLTKFDVIVGKVRNNIWNLIDQNELLTAARDRLLSRLMSGKIDVEKLDIHFPASMTEEVTANA
jgi:type I restriction enzyme S subunit